MRFSSAVVVALLAGSACLACGGVTSETEVGSADQAVTSWRTSYAALADARVPAAFAACVADLNKFDGQKTLPHEAKALRKRIGELRDMVDLFAFAYSKAGPGDPWADLRKALDEGYETVGAFKDLFDSQGLTLAVPDPLTGKLGEGVRPEDIVYDDPEELERRRDAVTEWKDAFMADVATHRAAVASADAAKMHKHDGKVLSKFFWGGADMEPSLDESGLENLSALSRALLELAVEDYADTKKLDEVTKLADHEQFHDLRKRVRSVVKTVDSFPELLEPGADRPLAVVRELVDRYGALNDEITALAMEPKKKKRDKMQAEIAEMWSDLRDWQKQVDASDALSSLRKKIRKHG